jgi:hypothetical protein
MELFLNLCWLSLLLPAWLLWRRRTSSTGSGSSAKGPVVRPLVFVCALGCALILLFPVISASDDLHAMRPEMEESERAFRHPGHCACTIHALAHFPQPVLPSSASLIPAFEQMGTVVALLPPTVRAFSVPAPAGRAPPSDHLTWL